MGNHFLYFADGFNVANEPFWNIVYGNTIYNFDENNYFEINSHIFVSSIDFPTISNSLIRETVKTSINPQGIITFGDNQKYKIKLGIIAETKYKHTEEIIPVSKWYHNMGIGLTVDTTSFSIQEQILCKEIILIYTNNETFFENKVKLSLPIGNLTLTNKILPFGLKSEQSSNISVNFSLWNNLINCSLKADFKDNHYNSNNFEINSNYNK